jgi:hypothetical protein
MRSKPSLEGRKALSLYAGLEATGGGQILVCHFFFPVPPPNLDSNVTAQVGQH